MAQTTPTFASWRTSAAESC